MKGWKFFRPKTTKQIRKMTSNSGMKCKAFQLRWKALRNGKGIIWWKSKNYTCENFTQHWKKNVFKLFKIGSGAMSIALNFSLHRLFTKQNSPSKINQGKVKVVLGCWSNDLFLLNLAEKSGISTFKLSCQIKLNILPFFFNLHGRNYHVNRRLTFVFFLMFSHFTLTEGHIQGVLTGNLIWIHYVSQGDLMFSQVPSWKKIDNKF